MQRAAPPARAPAPTFLAGAGRLTPSRRPPARNGVPSGPRRGPAPPVCTPSRSTHLPPPCGLGSEEDDVSSYVRVKEGGRRSGWGMGGRCSEPAFAMRAHPCAVRRARAAGPGPAGPPQPSLPTPPAQCRPPPSQNTGREPAGAAANARAPDPPSPVGPLRSTPSPTSPPPSPRPMSWPSTSWPCGAGSASTSSPRRGCRRFRGRNEPRALREQRRRRRRRPAGPAHPPSPTPAPPPLSPCSWRP